MGRQSSRIWYQQHDHKEMVTFNGSSYQYHDKAYIWNGSSFDLVWEKLLGLWFKKTDIYFYNVPVIIRNANGSVKYYIDYNPNKTYRKIFPDGTEETIYSNAWIQPTSQINVDYGSDMGYTLDGKIIAVGNNFRLTNPEISWAQLKTVYSMYDIENMSPIQRQSFMEHQNYQTQAIGQGWMYNVLGSGYRWAESNGNYKGMGVYYNYGSEPTTYYIRICLISTTQSIYADYAYALPSTFKYKGGSYYIYSDFISGTYYMRHHNKDCLCVFYPETDSQTGTTSILMGYEYELPHQSISGAYTGNVVQIDEGTIFNYELDGDSFNYSLIDITCPNYVPFDFSTMSFEIVKEGTCDLQSVIGDKTIASLNIRGEGVIGNTKYLYIDINYDGTDVKDHVRYDMDSNRTQVIQHVSTTGEIDPTLAGYIPETNLVIARMMRNAPRYCLCEITDQQPT